MLACRLGVSLPAASGRWRSPLAEPSAAFGSRLPSSRSPLAKNAHSAPQSRRDRARLRHAVLARRLRSLALPLVGASGRFIGADSPLVAPRKIRSSLLSLDAPRPPARGRACLILPSRVCFKYLDLVWEAAVYDYVIVGAGSAGCVLATRLSADPAECCFWRRGRRTTPRNPYPGRYAGAVQGHRTTGTTPPAAGRAARALGLLAARPDPRRQLVDQRDDLHPRPSPRLRHLARRIRLQGLGLHGPAPVLPARRGPAARRIGLPRRRRPAAGGGPAVQEPAVRAWVESAKAYGLAPNNDFNGAEQEGVGSTRSRRSVDGAGRRPTAPAARPRPAEPDRADRRPRHEDAHRERPRGRRALRQRRRGGGSAPAARSSCPAAPSTPRSC